MPTLEESVQQDTPRLVVVFQRDEQGNERFQWGTVGTMPVLTLLGYITRIQAELAFRSPPECGMSSLVIAWDAAERKIGYWVDPCIPIDPLVGMLETIKGVLVSSQSARTPPPIITPKRGLLGPDGRPMRG